MAFKDGCCMNCPDRKVGCHNVKTCSKWAEHEKNKNAYYEIVNKQSVSKNYTIESYYRNKHDR